MKIIVMGCGRVGAQTAAALWAQGNEVTVIDNEPQNFLHLPKELQEQEGGTILGDGTLEEDLVRAGIEEADVFVAVAQRDNKNALAAQKAKYIFKVPKVVCRIGDTEKQEMYNRLGLIAVSPTKVTSSLIIQAAIAES